MRLFCLITVLLLSIVGIAMSQSTTPHLTEPDAKQKFIGLSHIEIDLGQRNTLLVGFNRYVQVQDRQNIDSVLRLFVANYLTVEDTTQSPIRATHALFRLGETDRALALRYTPQPTTNFRFRDDDKPVEVKTQQDTLQIVWTSATAQALPNDFSIYLLINNLHDVERLLREGGINQKLQKAIEAVQAYKGHNLTSPRLAYTLLQGEDGKSSIVQPGLIGSPFLNIQPSIGVGLIRNQWVPSFNLFLSLIPSRFHRLGYGIGYTSTFFFSQSTTDGSFQAFRNDFLSVGVTIYGRKKDNRTTAFGREAGSFYVGMPVHRRGSYFEKNTFRLGGTAYHNGLFKVQPEIYMTGFFKKVYPGLRLVVGF
ncbi:hypothetical protein [Spirosoma radiotolerans]|uniref:Uncharacterized protein n=1 Tax=Spirosoma radiotolerans TaxID=1379870 RepID=A0A0E3V9W4_9BACT|nr:hypothetical protein [Spirosoma radiotolerans]AKD57531.1 hypothetical protein SD10_24165 [Spirosoma radiotolerans]